MDIFVLLATMLVCFLIGMPIAYSLALAAIVGAIQLGIPLEAVMLKISDGVSKVAMLTIPFFVLAGAITLLFVIERVLIGPPARDAQSLH